MSIRKYISKTTLALSAFIMPAAASAQESGPVVDYLYNSGNTVYFYIEQPDAEYESARVTIYDDVRSFTEIMTLDLLSTDLSPYAVSDMENVYAIPLPEAVSDVIVHQLKYKLPGQSEVTGRLYDGSNPFVYMTDLPRGTVKVGWGNPYYDKAYNGTEALRTTKHTYAKGYGVHAAGSVETPASLDLSQFTRFCADVGGQVITNPTRGKLGFELYNGVAQAFLNTGNVPWSDVYEWDFPLQHTDAGKTLKIAFTAGGDGNTNDIVCIGAPRFYYDNAGSAKEAQTVQFDNEGGVILESAPEVTLSAYATGGTAIHYSIVQGTDLATLEGNVLRPIPGKSGEIVVEAMTLGDRRYSPASASLTYKFNFGPSVRYLYAHKAMEDNSKQTVYLYVEPQDKQIEKLNIEIFENVRSLAPVASLNLTGGDLAKYATHIDNVYGIPVTVPAGTTPVHRLTYKFSGEDEVAGKYCEGDEPFDYLTDLPASTVRVGWSVAYYDKAFNGTEPLRNSKHTYAKGYGVHGAGWLETPASLDLSQFSRFSVDVGGQVISNPTRGRLGFALYNGVSQPYLNTGNVSWQDVYEWDFPLQSTGAGKTVKLTYTDGGDGNTNDVVCIGAPRFYYNYTDDRTAQTIDWTDEEIINNYVPFRMPMTATASSGLPIFYRIVRGGEYARIENNGTLSFYNIPSEGEVVVEAYQPGSKEFRPSDVSTCSFKIRKALVIRANERMEIEGGNDIDELVVYANSDSAGQAVVKNGIVNVKKLLLKYSFKPGEWNFITFPSDLDLNTISDLSAKGFSCAAEEGTPGTYILREYNTQLRAENPSESSWTSVTSGKVEGMKGYIMKLESSSETPVEINFTIDNVALDFSNTLRAMNLAVDLSQCEPETRHTVYIRPANVKGNTLRVDMRYVPSDLSQAPLNHAKALEEMRVTYTPVRGAIRLTLPEQSPAKVAIFDKKGKKLLKAVNYIAPMKIDISDLKPGQYRMVVVYGPASTERIVEL